MDYRLLQSFTLSIWFVCKWVCIDSPMLTHRLGSEGQLMSSQIRNRLPFLPFSCISLNVSLHFALSTICHLPCLAAGPVCSMTWRYISHVSSMYTFAMYTCIYICICICMCMYDYVCICIHIHIYIYIEYVYKYVYVYIYIYIYIYNIIYIIYIYIIYTYIIYIIYMCVCAYISPSLSSTIS